MFDFLYSIFEMLPTVGSLVLLAVHLILGFSLFRMSQACQRPRPWMAWVPYANVYLTGEIADHYHFQTEERTTTHRKRLLAWSIVFSAVTAIASAVVFLVACLIPLLAAALSNYIYTSLKSMLRLVLKDPTTFAIVLSCILVCLAFLIVFMIFYYIALHKIYKLFAPASATLLVILSIVIPPSILIIFPVLAFKTPVYSHDEGKENPSASVDSLSSL